MTRLRQIFFRLQPFFRRRKIEAQMSEEMHGHLEMATEANLAAGMSPEEARNAAQREFGGVDQVKESYRDERGIPWIEDLLRDVRYAVRQLAKHRGTTVVALLTIALCLGVNSAVFSLVYSVLLRPYPYPAAHRVVNLGMVWTKLPWGEMVQEISPPTFLEIEASAQSFASAGFIAADQRVDVHLPGRVLRVPVASVTPGVWSAAAVSPLIGRCFQAQDLAAGEGKLAVLSYDFWRETLNSDRTIVGQRIRLDDGTYEVLGVMPAGFSLAGKQARLWIPKVFSPTERSEESRGAYAFQAIARLKDGVALEQARQELKMLHENFLAAHPEAREQAQQMGATYGAAPLSTWVSSRVAGSTLFSVQAAAVLVLLVGCLNIAGILVVTTHGRLREFTLRGALGATPLRLARQLATETMMLFVLGGALAVPLALGALRLLPRYFDLDQTMPYGQSAQFHWPFVAVTLGVALLAGLLAAGLPVWCVARRDTSRTLQALGYHTTAGKRQNRTQSAFVVAQVALALVLLTAAGVTLRNVHRLLTKGFGVAVENRIVAQAALPPYRYGGGQEDTQAKINPFKQRALEKLRSLPGVRNATVSNRVPLSADWPMKFGFEVPGYEPAPGEQPAITFVYQVVPGFFHTLGMTLLRGRDLEPSDGAAQEPVVVISDQIARKYFAQGDPVGAQLVFFGRACRIVGVVGEVQNVPLSYGNAATIYLASAQWPSFRDEAVFVVQTDLPAEVMEAAVVKALQTVDPLLSVQVTNVARMQRGALFTQSAPAQIAGFFATMALLLTALGLYGVLTHTVAQRTREIGIRLALGAPRPAILRMVLFRGAVLALVGSALGVLVSVPLLQTIKALIVEKEAARADVLVLAAGVVLVVVVLAGVLPARRAAKVDPMIALRAE
jgi:predicted permease